MRIFSYRIQFHLFRTSPIHPASKYFNEQYKMNKTLSIFAIFTGFLSLIILMIYPIQSQAGKSLQNLSRSNSLSILPPPSDSLQLNNGKKWKVDEQMMKHIRNLEKDINTFDLSPEKSYKALSNKLQSHLNLLISNCTMKGKAHDELHKWLLPFMDSVKELGSSRKEEIGKNQFRIIHKSMREFNQYFE